MEGLPLIPLFIVQHSSFCIFCLALVGFEDCDLQIVGPSALRTSETNHIPDDIDLPHAQRRLMCRGTSHEMVRSPFLSPCLFARGELGRLAGGQSTDRQPMEHITGGAGQKDFLREGQFLESQTKSVRGKTLLKKSPALKGGGHASLNDE